MARQELKKLITVDSEEGKSAILMPEEFQQLITHGGMSYNDKVMLAFLAFTGVRYREFAWLSLHPEAFDPEHKLIKVPETKKKRRDAVKSRNVILSDRGLEIAKEFFRISETLPISVYRSNDAGTYEDSTTKKRKRLRNSIRFRWYSNHMLDYYVKQWAKRAGLDPTYLSVKSFRKTCIAWLVASHPTRTADILMSIGHNLLTDIEHYRNSGFSIQDVTMAKKAMAGWGWEDS